MLNFGLGLFASYCTDEGKLLYNHLTKLDSKLNLLTFIFLKLLLYSLTCNLFLHIGLGNEKGGTNKFGTAQIVDLKLRILTFIFF